MTPESSRGEKLRRRRMFAVFYLVALSVYGLINLYVFRRGWQSFGYEWGGLYTGMCVFLCLAFIAGRLLEQVNSSPLSTMLVWTGSVWLGAMAYFFLGVVAIDFARLLNILLHFLPDTLASPDAGMRQYLGFGMVAVVSAAIIAGGINAARFRIRRLDLNIDKPANGNDVLRIAAASDIHLGTIVSHRRLSRIVSLINGLQPDLILLPGDVIDEDLLPVINRNLGAVLRSLRAKYGVYAVTGNHEYIGGADAACRYLEEHGITVLRDASVSVAGTTLAGREDRSIGQFSGRTRKSLADLLMGTDPSHPIIMMDHQPFHLDEAAAHGVDLQLSGHTHHGQMWPFNYITQRVYELSWGYRRKGASHFYVSCGAGTWGPPVRTGNTPEILDIRLKFRS